MPVEAASEEVHADSPRAGARTTPLADTAARDEAIERASVPVRAPVVAQPRDPPEVIREVVTHRIERLETQRVERFERVDVSLVPVRAAPEGARVDHDREAREEPTPREAAAAARPAREAIESPAMNVVALPLASAPVQASHAPRAGEAAPRPLVVEIDRIDIRIEAERPAPAPRASRSRDEGPAPSLDAYLARRTEGSR
jgi:hypothetical protein